MQGSAEKCKIEVSVNHRRHYPMQSCAAGVVVKRMGDCDIVLIQFFFPAKLFRCCSGKYADEAFFPVALSMAFD
jgi:hypothetical protein